MFKFEQGQFGESYFYGTDISKTPRKFVLKEYSYIFLNYGVEKLSDKLAFKISCFLEYYYKNEEKDYIFIIGKNPVNYSFVNVPYENVELVNVS